MKKISTKVSGIIIAVLCVLFSANTVFAFSTAVHTTFQVKGAVHFHMGSNLQARTTENMYVNEGEEIVVRTYYSLVLSSDDKDIWFAIRHSNNSNSGDISLGGLENYVTAKPLSLESVLQEGGTEDIYNTLDYFKSNDLYYHLDEQAINSILAGNASKTFTLAMNRNYGIVTADMYNVQQTLGITRHSTSTKEQKGWSAGSFTFLKPDYKVDISQSVSESDKYNIGDKIKVSLKVSNDSNVYLQNAKLNIYNSQTESTYLSNVSNLEIKHDSNIKINNSTNSNAVWSGKAYQTQTNPASIDIGTWQGSNEFLFLKDKLVEDNNIYVTFDYLISEEDLTDDGKLVIRSEISATSPEHSFSVSNYANPNYYYFNGYPVSVVNNLSKEGIDIISIKAKTPDNTEDDNKEQIETSEDETENTDEEEQTNSAKTSDNSPLFLILASMIISGFGMIKLLKVRKKFIK